MKNKVLFTFVVVCFLTSCTKKPGILTGNVYWKYNEYVGNKPDAGSKVKIHSLSNKEISLETTTDVAGNYKIEEIPLGKYLLVIKSSNTTDSPKDHLNNLIFHSDNIKKIYGFDIQKHKKEIAEIDNLNSQYQNILMDENATKYGGLSKQIDKYEEIKRKVEDKSLSLISKFPSDFKSKVEMYSGYDKSFHFAIIEIKEGKTTNENVDFGITYN